VARKSVKSQYYNILIQILKKFSATEIIQFTKFINSPYYNRSRKLILFFNNLIKFHPDYDSEKIRKEFFVKKLKHYHLENNATYRHLISDVIRLVEKFLVAQRIKKDDCLWNDLLFEEIYESDLQNILGNRLKKFEKKSRDLIKIESRSLLHLYNIEGYKLNYSLGNISDNVRVTDYKLSIRKKRYGYLLLFYLIEMVKELDEIQNMNLQSGISVEKTIPYEFKNTNLFVKLFDTYLALYNDEELKQIVNVYYALYNLILNPNSSKLYKEFKTLLIRNSERLSSDERSYLFNKLTESNLLKLRKKTSSTKLHKELMGIYTLILKKEYYNKLSGKFIPIEVYRNILVISTRLKMFKWVEKFIHDYNNKIVPVERKNIFNYSMGLLSFEMEDYDKAFMHISKVNLGRISFKLDIKDILLKLYYLLDHHESEISLIQAYRLYLKNNKSISSERKIMHENFINIMSQLLKFKIEPEKVNIEILYNNILKSTHLIHKSWLLHHIEILNRNFKRVI